MKIPRLTIGKITVPLPIIQGGMGVRVSLAGLAAAVANEGGIGTIASVGLGDIEASKTDFERVSREALVEEIRRAKSLTDGPIAVNIMGVLSNARDLVQTSVREGIKLIVSGASLPLKLPEMVERRPGLSHSDRQLRPGGRHRPPDLGQALSRGRPTPSSSRARWPEVIWDSRPNSSWKPEKYSLADPSARGPGRDQAVRGQVRRRRSRSSPAAGSIPETTSPGCSRPAPPASRWRPASSARRNAKSRPEFKQTYLDAKEEDIVIIKSPVGLPGRADPQPLPEEPGRRPTARQDQVPLPLPVDLRRRRRPSTASPWPCPTPTRGTWRRASSSAARTPIGCTEIVDGQGAHRRAQGRDRSLSRSHLKPRPPRSRRRRPRRLTARAGITILAASPFSGGGSDRHENNYRSIGLPPGHPGSDPVGFRGPGPRDRRPARRPHAVVARGPLRHVHPLGPLRRPGRRVEGQDRTTASGSANSAQIPVAEYDKFAAPVQPGQVRRRRSGSRMAKDAGHEVHRHHQQAPRRLLPVRLEAHRLRRHGHALQARHPEGAGRGVPQGRASRSASTTRSWTGTIPTTCRAAAWENDRPADGRRLRPLRRVHEGAAQGAGRPTTARSASSGSTASGRTPGPTSAARTSTTTSAASSPSIIVNNRVGKGRAGMAGLDQGRGVGRRLRHARAGDPRHRPARRRLGNLHDDERHTGATTSTTRTGSRPRT